MTPTELLGSGSRYRRVAPLGSGAEGEVWRGEDRSRGGHPVALKRLRQAPPSAWLRAAAAIDLPGVAKVLDCFSGPEGTWLVSELARGAPLDTLPVARCVEVAARLADTLDALHREGLVHGDIKAENVLIDGERVTLVDLGALWQRDHAPSERGTLSHLAPEALAGERTPQTDLYALGVTLTLWFGGGHPFVAPGASLDEALGTLARPRGVRIEALEAIPPALRGAIEWLLAWAPEARPADAAAWRARWCHDAATTTAKPLTLRDELPARVPRVGGEGAVEALLTAARDPRCVAVLATGPSGSGRRRALDDALRSLQVDAASRGVLLDVGATLPERISRPTVLLRADADLDALAGLVATLSLRGRYAQSAPRVLVLASASSTLDADGVACVPVAPLDRPEAQRLLDALHGAKVPGSAVDVWLDVTAGLAGRIVELARRVTPAAIVTATRAQLYAALARDAPPPLAPLDDDAWATLSALSRYDGTISNDLLFSLGAPRSVAVLRRLGLLIPRAPGWRLDPRFDRESLSDQARREGARRVLDLAPRWSPIDLAARASASAAVGDRSIAYDLILNAATHAETPRDQALRWLREAAPWAPDPAAHRRLLAATSLRAGAAREAIELLAEDPSAEAEALRVDALRRAGEAAEARALAARLAASTDGLLREVGSLALARDALDRGDLAEAEARATLEVSPTHEAWACELRALAACALGDLDRAQAACERGERAALRTADATRRHRLRAVAGIIAQRRGDARGAQRLHREAWLLALDVGDLDAAAADLVNVGGAALDAGDLGEALRSLERALEPLALRGRESALARALGNLASLLAWIGDGAGAASAVTRAEEAALRADDALALGFSAGVRAELEGDIDALCEAALRCRRAGDPSRSEELCARAALLAVERSMLDEGRALLPEAGGAMVALASLALALAEGQPAPTLAARLARCDAALAREPLAELSLIRHRLAVEVARASGDLGAAAEVKARWSGEVEALASTLPSGLGASLRGRWSPPAEADRSTSNDRRWRSLASLTRRISAEAHLPTLLALAVDAVTELTGAARGMVLLRGDDGELTTEVARGGDGAALSEDDRRFSRSVAARAASSGEALVTFDAASDLRFDAAASVTAMGLRSILAVPLRYGGEVMGALYVDDRVRVGTFDDAAIEVATAFADAAAVAIHNVRAREDLEDALRRAERLSHELDELAARQRVELEVAREATNRAGLRGSYPELVGRGAAMSRALATVDRVAPTSMPVLILGESGTGKELFARAIHANSPRAAGAFVAENCSAIAETLLESALFGHVRGAFTGADRARAGLFEAADGGTLFLDEIGEMSLSMQSRLLRVLQEGEVRPVGGDRVRRVDVRVIAATHRDLGEMVRAGRFREDLYYRLAVLVLQVPPLRSRREDIPALVQHFLSRHEGVSIARNALARLVAAPWPGNVRELENVLRRAAVMAPEGTIGLADLDMSAPPAEAPHAAATSIREAVNEVERSLVVQALRAQRGNQSRAARALGLSRFGLQKKMKRLGISARELADEGG